MLEVVKLKIERNDEYKPKIKPRKSDMRLAGML